MCVHCMFHITYWFIYFCKTYHPKIWWLNTTIIFCYFRQFLCVRNPEYRADLACLCPIVSGAQARRLLKCRYCRLIPHMTGKCQLGSLAGPTDWNSHGWTLHMPWASLQSVCGGFKGKHSERRYYTFMQKPYCLEDTHYSFLPILFIRSKALSLVCHLKGGVSKILQAYFEVIQ